VLLDPRASAVRVGVFALWGLTVGAGLLILGAYHARPGSDGSPPGRWPPGSPIHPGAGGPNLLLFLHPRCPCSPASLAGLAEVVGRCRGRFTPHIVLVKPGRTSGGWDGTGVEREAAAIPGARVWDDRGGVEARRFGVATSGQVLLFDGAGALAFRGGITPARGDRGPSFGRDAVTALILGRPPASGESPVFGCPLDALGAAVDPEASP
jgi:hypothetical protein